MTLSNCPFCGKSVAKVSGLNVGRTVSRHVWCSTEKGGCGATGPSFRGQTQTFNKNYKHKKLSPQEAEKKATDGWNQRSS